jgi:hypothetical protein
MRLQGFKMDIINRIVAAAKQEDDKLLNWDVKCTPRLVEAKVTGLLLG